MDKKKKPEFLKFKKRNITIEKSIWRVDRFDYIKILIYVCQKTTTNEIKKADKKLRENICKYVTKGS